MKKKKKIILNGHQIYLRELCASDVTDVYCGWMNDSEITRFMESGGQVHTRESIIDFVSNIQNNPSYVFLAIILRSNDRHIGNIKLGPINEKHRRGDIGILIGEKDCWGKGYASEAIALLCDYAFCSLKIHKLTAGCCCFNKGSEMIFRKNKFHVECIKREHEWHNDQYVDCFSFSKINPNEQG